MKVVNIVHVISFAKSLELSPAVSVADDTLSSANQRPPSEPAWQPIKLVPILADCCLPFGIWSWVLNLSGLV